jgi:hypothetical protein
MLKFLFYKSKMPKFKDAKSFCTWFLSGLLSFALLLGRITAIILDLFAFPEIMDLIWQKVKLNTRNLTLIEEQEAQSVFGNSIDYSTVLIDEFSLIARVGAKINKYPYMGVTIFHTINFNRKVRSASNLSDMKWLIHELTHIAQMEHAGSRYLVEALHAQVTEGYEYIPGEKPHLRDYNREQQAEIVADYYIKRILGASTTSYEPYITELRDGKL